ncbi:MULTISPECIES: nucleoside hydrolase-like domain-containing protein [unclassified Paraflavitalea]|uniref:nucleoside hydrolase-like domain-containing protein n=1 Tax=unclassified Paraflavitalea TaxID=2798305 RepID=UPI003D33083F
MKKQFLLIGKFLLFFSLMYFFTAVVKAQVAQNNLLPRVVITADPELDDANSLIRFLLYSTDVKVEGLIYASSGFHWTGDGKGTKWYVEGREYTRFGLKICPCERYRWDPKERFIHDAVETYEKVYPNLIKHHSNYPKPSYLKSVIKWGNIEFDGDISKDSEGSNWIKSLLLDNNASPLYVTAWGGQSTIARALKSIEDEFKAKAGWDAIRKKVSKKLVILPSGDQDGTYEKYIKPNWPDVEYREFKNAANFAYGAQLSATEENAYFLTTSWMKENVSSKGPFGSLYRVWGDGKQMVKGDVFDYFGVPDKTNEELRAMGYIVWLPVQEKGSWLGEGDTFTFMNLLDNGLLAYWRGGNGGWGGRQLTASESNPNFMQLPDSATLAANSGMLITASSAAERAKKANEGIPYPNFFPAAQNDFAARMRWSVSDDFKKANHHPIIKLDKLYKVVMKPGTSWNIKATITDPDNDKVSFKWWQLRSFTNQTQLSISDPNSLSIKITVPATAKEGEILELVLEVKDNGSPALTKYQKVLILVGK